MSGAKKIETVFDDQVNAKIQRKFDLVFIEKPVDEKTSTNANSSMVFNDDSIDFNSGMDEEFVMEKNGKKSNASEESNPEDSSINLDFSLDDETTDAAPETMATASATTGKGEVTEGLDFEMDFNLDSDFESTPSAPVVAAENLDESVGFTLDDSDIGSMEFDESTKKTVMVSRDQLTHSNLEEFSLEKTGSFSSTTSDLMSSEEAKANIESTIKDILRPKVDVTKEIGLDGLEASGGMSDIEDSELLFREGTPSKGFDINGISDEEIFEVENKSADKKRAMMTADSTGDFDLEDLDTSFNADEDAPTQIRAATPKENSKASKNDISAEPISHSKPSTSSAYDSPPSMGMGGSNITTEDSMRFQATIRALREEREEMLLQIKKLKTDSKELEQDNLTLKANLDEAKIEITILRKRHMVEVEDIKYRLSMSEEKKAMADEKARQADSRREKLEQKVRIDFNQVKQREKELESKLELLSMDVDSQVQSRDHKILELRRKIDALEFNMENASIKEQKSLDDKRKLEDRLNKIMKTLRHSIKNLEDDIDHAHDDDDHQKEKN